ncbi:DUF4233 domain-containing protein [Glaciihabitans sp. dw_435]|uniref:DUF4233 domain-containing protein n=1 Tax=Glaciihabitans sp. dw_435 TaxID=2720081 RepID=UPI001BD6716D|nr:DUF4233 domain-containing protein [Glaciihabitans sp. dw_435]
MTEPRQARPRRARSVTEMLLSIVLVLEAVLGFFITLTVFGLKALDPFWAFGGGALLCVLLLLTALVLRFPWGMWLGWALQLALILTGIILPTLYVVGAVFVAIWVFCFWKGRQLDRFQAAAAASFRDTDPTTPPTA